MKKILVNGSARSGTTFTGVLINKFTNEDVIEEPLYVTSKISELFLKDFIPKHGRISKDVDKMIKDINKNFIFEVYKKHSKFLRDPSKSYFFNTKDLKNFLLEFEDYHIKEVVLHFYLNEDFINENWRVFHILRYPVDNYISFMNVIIQSNFIGKINTSIYDLNMLSSDIFSNFKEIFIKYFSKSTYNNIEGLLNYYVVLKEPSQKELEQIKKVLFKSTRSIFLFRWILTNYYAVNNLSEKQILIFENKESLYKLFPNNSEFEELVNKLYKPNNYKNMLLRRKLDKEFRSIVENLNLADEYNFLINFFNY